MSGLPSPVVSTRVRGTRGGRGLQDAFVVVKCPVASAGRRHSPLRGFESYDVLSPCSRGVGEEPVTESGPPAWLPAERAVDPVALPSAGVLVAAEPLEDQQHVAEGGRRVGCRPQCGRAGQPPGPAAVPVAQWCPAQHEVAGALRLGRDEPPALALRPVVVLAQDDPGVVLSGFGEVENGAVGRALDEVEARFALSGDDVPLLALLAGGGVRLADAAVRGGGVVEHLAVDRVADYICLVGLCFAALRGLHRSELPLLRFRAAIGEVADDERPVRARRGFGAEGLPRGGVDGLQLQFFRGHGHRGTSSRRLGRWLGTVVVRPAPAAQRSGRRSRAGSPASGSALHPPPRSGPVRRGRGRGLVCSRPPLARCSAIAYPCGAASRQRRRSG
ncbi:hypothetical protein SAMN05216268_1143 [Streptomyces yunnanensis]|uniref:Uncharacterized protein n=1 Tax=Streptomyces yunnanensis TaxID=156453 RepID=A0A9X8QWY2_9ACTN|nr:hypothetical protein SAMN05216268_1143 [Streptomyces yunnanensis]